MSPALYWPHLETTAVLGSGKVRTCTCTVHVHCVGELASHKRSLTHHRLGIQVSIAIICLFVWAMVGWVTLPFFSYFFKLVCYAQSCISMYIHVCQFF